MSLHVEIQGEGFPILCLHGHPGSGRCLSVFTSVLAQNYQTISPDLRGYGRSKSRNSFTMEQHVDDLFELLDRLNIRRCLVLGWSLGGILALELALRQPQRFSGLILIASAARPRGSHPAVNWLDLLFTGVAATINYVKPAWQWNIDTFARRSLFRYLFTQHHETAYSYLAREAVPAYLQTSPAAKGALNRAIRSGYNRLDHLHKIQVPCLVLAAENDRHITPQSSLATAERLPNSVWHCYEATAHLFPWEIPDRVNQKIQQWLAQYPQVVSG